MPVRIRTAAAALAFDADDLIRLHVRHLRDRTVRPADFERIDLRKTSGVICLEMMKKIQDAGFTIVEVPVHHYHRAFGRSQFFNFSRIFRTGVDVLFLWFDLVVRQRHLRTPAVRPAKAGGGVDPNARRT